MELIYENVKYNLRAYRIRSDAYMLSTNESYVEADLRRMPDGGCLIRFAGHSFITYLKEEVCMCACECMGLYLKLVALDTCVYLSKIRSCS